MEAVLAGMQTNDIVRARAAARALVAFLDGLPQGSSDGVIKLAEVGAAYGRRPIETETRHAS
jgi:hypothetical protein